MRFAHRARTSLVSLAALTLTFGASAEAQGTGTKSATTSTSTGASAATIVPVPPTAVSADGTWPGVVIVYFGFTQSGMRYRIERTAASYSSKTAANWQLRQTTGPLPCCSYSVVDSSSSVTSANGVMYRVTTVSPSVSMRVPPSTISPVVYLNVVAGPGPITGAAWALRPTQMSLRTARVGTMVGVSGSKTISFDSSVVSVAPNGGARASGPGVTYIFWLDVSASGQPKVRGERVTVVP
jgi:hypothetical protein